MPSRPFTRDWTPNTKFGVLALDNCLELAITAPLKLSESATIYPYCPVAFPDHWREWLGTLQTAAFEKASLAIVVERPSKTPHDLDHEIHEIDLELRAHFCGILLNGIPDYRDGLVAIGGVNEKAELAITQVRRLHTAYRHEFGKRLTIDGEVVQISSAIGAVVLDLHSNKQYRRVRAGFKALVRAIEEFLPEERLHQYVRSVDGLTMLPKGKGEEQFIVRAQTFATGDKLPMVLQELYRLRNAQEHLNEIRAVIVANSDQEAWRLISLRGYQAEQLALAAYRRLLTTPELLARFESDESTAAFWNLSVGERCIVWGEPFDLDQAEKDHEKRFNLLKTY